MPQYVWSQLAFSKGELSPLMYSRVDVELYFSALKTAKNVITYPQGGAGKRFGTIYLNEISGVTSYEEIYFEAFPYLNECTYVLVIIPDNILIYLEGTLVSTVTSTGIVASEIPDIDTTILDASFRVCGGNFAPKDLVRTASSASTLSSVASDVFTFTGALTADTIYPVRFATTGVLPDTTPQIRTGKTYFINPITTLTTQVFSTAQDAKSGDNPYTLTDVGTGTNTMIPYNTWTFADVSFDSLPFYDFDGGYSSITFTPGAVSGYGVTITMSGAMSAPASMTSKFAGGAFIGNGGKARIVSVTDTTHFVVDIIDTFDDTTAIPGNLVIVAEPAWSDNRGWPQSCSSFQSRAIFANTELLPNGIWLSAINDYNYFSQLEVDDDDAISYFPSSDTVNAIRFLVPYRSLTVHTNTGIYSTPLSFEQALTPSNFSLSLQDSTPATAIQPRGIDNQIVVISGNDVHSMLWDGFNNSYNSTIASVANEHLIDNPHDESAYTDLNRAGSRYMFIINEDGSMVIFQTLIAENVAGFTPQYLEQPYGEAYFRWATSSPDGRAWFICEREIASAASGVNLIGNTDTTFEATSSSFSTTEATACEFTTTGTLPVTTPQIEVDVYYWAIGEDADNFYVYLTKEDAENGENEIEIADYGTNSQVVPWPLSTKFYLEQLSFDTYVDCATIYNGAATSSVGSLPRFNAQEVSINGDGYGFTDDVINDTVEFIAHGASVDVEVAQIGFPINYKVIPLPVATPGQLGNRSSSLVFPQHIRTATIMYSDSIGGEINGRPIQYKNLYKANPGTAPIPSTGILEFSVMNGWNEFKNDGITITHSDPFEFKLIGLFYQVEVS